MKRTSSSFEALTFETVPWRLGWSHRCCHRSESPPSKEMEIRLGPMAKTLHDCNHLLLPSPESFLQVIIVPRLKSPPAIPKMRAHGKGTCYFYKEGVDCSTSYKGTWQRQRHMIFPKGFITWTLFSPSLIKPLPLLFSCINRGCVVQLLTRLLKKVEKSHPMITSQARLFVWP